MRNFTLFIFFTYSLLTMGQTVVKIPFVQPEEFSVSPQTVYKSAGDLPLEIGLEVLINGGSGVYNFSWFFNGSSIGTTPTINVTQEGTYLLTVEDGKGCASSVSYMIGTSGISDNTVELPIRLYPNPSQGNITLINQELLPISRIEVLQSNGSLIQSYQVATPTKEYAIDLSGHPSGYYLIVSYIENRKISQILILE